MCRLVWGGCGLLLAHLVLLSSDVNAQPAPEMRGMWVTRFEWPDSGGNVEKMQKRIREIMATLGQNGFNAVFFQIRGQADVLYPSPFEPWSPLIGGDDPGFDPLEFAIAEAKKHNLEFHAYINPFPSWNDDEAPPKDPEHPYHRFPEWACVDEAGKPVYAEYFYFSPGNPAVQAYLRQVIRDVATRYEVDGIHLDRIRYPDPGSSHDTVSRTRFETTGNPMRLEWEDWQRNQITRFVYDLYGELQEIRPAIKLSAAVWGIYDRYRIDGYSGFSSGYHMYYQDSFGWMRAGAMDALVPMIYWPIGGNRPHYDELYADFVENGSFGRHIYGGISARHEPKQIQDIFEFTRKVNGPGTVVFSHSGAEKNKRFPLYRRLYRQSAPVPPMPWKDQPTRGHIVGTILDGNGEPVTDAWVRVEGLGSTWLSSGDGFFAVLNLEPGEHKLSVARHGGGRASENGIVVEGGKATRIELRLGE